MDLEEKNLDSRLRHKARHRGLRVFKSRERTQHANNRGGYQLVNDNNVVVAGVDFDIPLNELEDWIDRFTR